MITIRRNNETLGRYDSEQIVSLIKVEQLAGTDLAWVEGTDKWEPLACLDEFSELFPSTPKATAPVPNELHSSASGGSILGILCVLTILGSIFGMLRGMFYEVVSGLFDGSMDDLSYWHGWAYLALNLGTLIGATMMLRSSLSGLKIYTATQIPYLLVASHATLKWAAWGAGVFALSFGAVFILPSLIFLILYWSPGARSNLR